MITAIDGRPINSASDLSDIMDQHHHPGDVISADLDNPRRRRANRDAGAGEGPVG